MRYCKLSIIESWQLKIRVYLYYLYFTRWAWNVYYRVRREYWNWKERLQIDGVITTIKIWWQFTKWREKNKKERG